MELGAVLLVKLNGFFVCKLMCGGTFALYAKGLVTLTPDIEGSYSTWLQQMHPHFVQQFKESSLNKLLLQF